MLPLLKIAKVSKSTQSNMKSPISATTMLNLVIIAGVFKEIAMVKFFSTSPITDRNIYKYVITHFLCMSKISVVGCYKQTPVLMVTGDWFSHHNNSDWWTYCRHNFNFYFKFKRLVVPWTFLQVYQCVCVCVCVFLSVHVWVITWNRQEGKITSRCIFCLIIIIIFKAQILWKIWMLVKNMMGWWEGG